MKCRRDSRCGCLRCVTAVCARSSCGGGARNSPSEAGISRCSRCTLLGHCHDADVRPEQPLVLVGNPNCGKSVVFHHLTGVYATVSNYPGTTLALAQGTFREWQVIDTPGVYGISDFTPEERITREVLKQAHIINVGN